MPKIGLFINTYRKAALYNKTEYRKYGQKQNVQAREKLSFG